MNHEKLRVEPGTKAGLRRRKTNSTDGFKSKEEAREKLTKDIARMQKLQDVFYAADTHSLLIIFRRWTQRARTVRSNT